MIFLAAVLAGTAFASPFQALEEVVSQARDFSDFLSRPDLTQAYKKALQEYYGQSKFQCETFEAILERLARLNQEVPGFGAEVWKPQNDPALIVYKSDSGGSTQARERWELAPVPRKLHAIWNDPSQRGCVSEDCGKADVTSPERWAVGLPGSQTFLLHRGDKFGGAGVVVLPVAKGKQVFSLLTQTGSASLSDKAELADSPTGSVSYGSIYDQLVERLVKASPALEPIVVQYDKKDPSVGRMTRLRPSKGRKAFAGFLDEFKPADAMATGVARAMPRKCFARKGKEAINLFSGFGSLGGAASSGNFWSPAAVRDLLVQIANPENLSSVANVPQEQKSNVGKTLSEIMSKDKDAALREKAALALKLLDGFGTEDSPSESIVTAARTPASVDEPATAPRALKKAGNKFSDAFKKALGDESPGVRGVAASALAAGGDRSPQVSNAISQALNASDRTPAGLTPGQLAATAAEGQSNGGIPFTPPQEQSLFDRLRAEQDAATRRRLTDELARNLLTSGDELSRDRLEDLAANDPRTAQEVIDAANNDANKICEDKKDFDRALENEKQADTDAGGAAMAGAAGAAFLKNAGNNKQIKQNIDQANGATAAQIEDSRDKEGSAVDNANRSAVQGAGLRTIGAANDILQGTTDVTNIPKDTIREVLPMPREVKDPVVEDEFNEQFNSNRHRRPKEDK